MSEPITQNEMQHMLDRTIERINNDIHNKLSNIEFRVNQISQELQQLRNDVTRLGSQVEVANRPEPPVDNTYRI